jgi:hypothetical protein
MIRWLAFFLLVSWPASGGAWTERAGHVQVITTLTSSNATSSFDEAEAATIPSAFNKTTVETVVEYGLTGAVTLLFKPAFVNAYVATPGTRPDHSTSFSLEGGARVLLFGGAGKTSCKRPTKPPAHLTCPSLPTIRPDDRSMSECSTEPATNFSVKMALWISRAASA